MPGKRGRHCIVFSGKRDIPHVATKRFEWARDIDIYIWRGSSGKSTIVWKFPIFPRSTTHCGVVPFQETGVEPKCLTPATYQPRRRHYLTMTFTTTSNKTFYYSQIACFVPFFFFFLGVFRSLLQVCRNFQGVWDQTYKYIILRISFIFAISHIQWALIFINQVTFQLLHKGDKIIFHSQK